MIETLTKNKVLWFIFAIALALATLFPSLLLVIAIAVILLLGLQIVSKNVIIFLIILSFLTLTSTISVELRATVQILCILILFYYFFKTYGLEFSRYPKIPIELGLLVSLIILSMIIATTFSSYFILGIQQIYRLAVFLFIVYFLYALTKEHNNVRALFYALLVVGLIYTAFIFNELAKNNFNFIELNISQLEKVSSSYVNLNSIGAFFIIIISIVLSFLFSKKGWRVMWLLMILFVLFIGGLFLTNSRGAILAVILSSLFVFFMLNKKVFYKLLLFILLLIPLLFIEPISEMIDIYFRLERLTTGRDLIFDNTFNIIRNNPILGVGPAVTKYAMYPNLNVMLGSPAENFLAFHYNEIEFGHAHNFYLFFWSDLGLLGLFSAVLLPIAFFKLCSNSIKKTKNANIDYYLISIGITAAGIGLFVRGIFEWGNLISYGTLGTDLPFWILLIILSFIVKNDINPSAKIL